MNIGKAEVTKKTGEEDFTIGGKPVMMKLKDFWGWSSSDILNNAMRGVLAEYIVACDLSLDDGFRTEWDAYDLITRDGIKIEIKSCAYLQSWDQHELSSIQFGIRPTKVLIDGTNNYSKEMSRQSEVYVFCVLSHKDKSTVDPLNMNQWEFYVLSTKILNDFVPNQKTIGLSSLLKLNPVKVNYGEIGDAINSVAVYKENTSGSGGAI